MAEHQNQQTPSFLRRPDLEFTSPDQSIYHASFNPSKYLQNLTIFRPEAQLQVQQFSPNLGSYNDSQKIFRKYFSKKVSHITCFRERFLKNKGNYAKKLKRLTLIQPRQPFKAPSTLKHLSILENDSQIQIKNLNIRKLTNSCKNLENLFYDQILHTSFLKSIRKLINLRMISLVLTDQQIIQNGHLISNLRHLEKVKILVRESHLYKTPEKIDKFLSFFETLSKKNLIAFEVNLQRSELGRDEECLEELMSVISQSQIPEYNLQIMLEDNSSLEMRKVKPLLQRCDFLGLHSFGRTSIPTLSLPHSLIPKKKRINEAQRKTSQHKKVLEITFQKIYEPFLLSLIQVYQNSSSSLNRKGLFMNLKEMGTSLNLLLKFSQLQNFNNLIIDLENLPDKYMKSFTLGLAKVLKKASNLDSLVLGDSNPWIYTSSASNPSNQILQRQLSEMKSIKKLHIENLTINVLSWDNLQQVLRSLPNLENLYFSLRLKQNHPASNMTLPFDELKNIQKFKLNTAGLSQENELLLQFINSIHKLQKLKVFEISGEGFKNMKPNEFQLLLQQLRTLKNLRKVRISVSFDYTEMTNIGMNFDNLFAQVKQELRNMFYQNINLKEVCVYQPDWFEFKYIR